MFFSPQRLSVSWAGVCIALTGAVYCAVQIAPLPVSIPCPGNGCDLFKDFTVFGVSLWWVGVAYFTTMAVLCLRRTHGIAYPLAAAALLADAFLLAVMLATASCVTCLGAGFLIALLYIVLRRHLYAKAAPGLSALLLVWSGLFVAALAFAATEKLGPWHLAGKEHTDRRVYFSPSCPACRDALTVFDGSAAFIPIAEKPSDYAAIHGMRAELAQGKTLVQALGAVTNGTPEEPPFPESVFLRIMLARNKAEVLRLGFNQLPLIMINGMPQSLRSGHAATQPPSPATTRGGAYGNGVYGYGLPPELADPVDSCGDGAPEPCDQPN